MFHKVKDIRALPNLKLSVQFAEGVTKIYDIRPLIHSIPIFSELEKNEELFYSVSVDVGGYGVVWNDDLDLSCDELWDKGKKVTTPFDGLLSMGDATQLWNLNESTLRKAISYGKIVPGVDACKFGKQWVITEKAMEREYGNRTSYESLVISEQQIKEGKTHDAKALLEKIKEKHGL